MAAASTVNHVRIWRPMLAHTKADVYAHAHAYGVPYFKDSTPEWSTRGKLRNQSCSDSSLYWLPSLNTSFYLVL